MVIATRVGLALSALGCHAELLPDPLPSTFEFVDPNYQGNRFEDQQVAVFGGTSGMGFATAAMFVQECASRTVLIGRNAKKCDLAARVIKEKASQAHCARQGTVECHQADITNKQAVRRVMESFSNTNDGRLPVVVTTASVAGYVGSFADLPDDILFTGRDAIYNNLYGTKNVAQEALKFWGKTGCLPLAGQPCPALDYVPSLIVVGSTNSITPCPTCESYGVSKHGLVGLASSLSKTYEGELRVNAILPGLVDTPLTWNQVRNANMLPDGNAQVEHPSMQTSWQCIVDGKLIESGECPDGGTGYGCPCEDVARDDPRNAAIWGKAGMWPALDPRRIGDAILDISQASSSLTGASRIVDTDGQQYMCAETDAVTDASAWWRSCPRPQVEMFAERSVV